MSLSTDWSQLSIIIIIFFARTKYKLVDLMVTCGEGLARHISLIFTAFTRVISLKLRDNQDSNEHTSFQVFGRDSNPRPCEQKASNSP